MIHYNNPEYAKERQNVVPLRLQDSEFIKKMISSIIDTKDPLQGILKGKILQLIGVYENLVHNNDVNVPELKRLLSEKKSIQSEMDKIVQDECFETGKEQDKDYYKLFTRKNEITEQIEKLIEQL